MSTRRRALVAVAALSAVAVAGAVSLVLADGSGRRPSGQRTVLRLDLAAGTEARAAAGPASGYRLVGPLPTEAPATPAWDLASGAGADAVARLAEALHAGTPARDGAGWRTQDGLLVSPDGSWSWPCADGVVSSDGTQSCAVGVGTTGPGTVSSGGATATAVPGSTGDGGGSAPGSVAPAPPASSVKPLPPASPEPVPVPPPTVRPVPTAAPDLVLRTAGPVLAAVGLAVADARVEGPVAVVDPEVGGLPTYGMATRVTVDADGTLSNASGRLVRAERGDTYPLRTARDVFDDLPPLPQPMLACPVSPGSTACPEPKPVEVTGARLGLALERRLDGADVLVPAWLFAVRGWTVPLVGLAVEQRYLGGPTPAPTTRTDEPAPPPVGARAPFSFDTAARVPGTAAVVVTYGDSSSCPHEKVTDTVKESADSVVVLLEAQPRPTGVACTDDYRAVRRTVRLQQPLGTRTLVDGATGRAVPVA